MKTITLDFQIPVITSAVKEDIYFRRYDLTFFEAVTLKNKLQERVNELQEKINERNAHFLTSHVSNANKISEK